jgi:hypothetical protein
LPNTSEQEELYVFRAFAYTVGIHRDVRARKDLALRLARVGLPYHSPHKLGRATLFMLSCRQKDIAALKAISQNLMHLNLSITDGIYAILSDLDVKNQIQLLGKNQDENILQKLRELLNGF